MLATVLTVSATTLSLQQPAAQAAPVGGGDASSITSAQAPAPTAASTPALLPASAAQTLDTAYPVPASALVVAVGGSDANPGSLIRPLATLQTALTRAAAGQTVVVRGGVYRQGVADPGAAGYSQDTSWLSTIRAGVTVQAYPHETVWFDGTDVTRGWVRDGSGWSIPWSTPTFCGAGYYRTPIQQQASTGPCGHRDMVEPGTPIGSPQMVFRAGRPVPEVASRASLTASSFYYDQVGHRLHVGFDPTGVTVEATRRAQALAIYNAPSLSIRGIGFRRYGTNEYTNATGGAVVLNQATNALIERSVFTENAGGGLLSWSSRGLVVRSSFLSNNGFNGMLATGSERAARSTPGIRDDLVLESSRVDGNNTDGFGRRCAASCAAAGAKFAYMVGATVRNNSFSRNGGGRASGFWCDLACSDTWIYGNSVVGNALQGIFYEVGNTGTIASNFIAGNGYPSGASGLMVGSANTRVLNNTIVDNWNNVLLYDDARPTGPGVGPNTVNTQFINNIVAGGDVSRPQVTLRAGTSSVTGNTRPSTFMRGFDYNAYHRPLAGARWWVNWEEQPFVNSLFLTPSALYAAHHLAAHDVHLQAAADPFFVSAPTRDYRVRTGSPAWRSGLALPADVAGALGVPASPVDRGTLWSPGSAPAQ